MAWRKFTNHKLSGLCAGIALLGVMGSSPRATDPEGRYVELGFGTESCGRFVGDRGTGEDNGYRGWLTGYLSRYNFAKDGTYNILGHSDIEGALLWIENYCRAHPLDDFATATRKLISELYPNRLKSAPPPAK